MIAIWDKGWSDQYSTSSKAFDVTWGDGKYWRYNVNYNTAKYLVSKYGKACKRLAAELKKESWSTWETKRSSYAPDLCTEEVQVNRKAERLISNYLTDSVDMATAAENTVSVIKDKDTSSYWVVIRKGPTTALGTGGGLYPSKESAMNAATKASTKFNLPIVLKESVEATLSFDYPKATYKIFVYDEFYGYSYTPKYFSKFYNSGTEKYYGFSSYDEVVDRIKIHALKYGNV